VSNEQTQANLSADEIEAQLRMTRIELTNTVDQLVTQLHPSYQIEQAKQKERARSTWELAREGDTDAMRTLGIAACSVVAVVGLVAWRITSRVRRSGSKNSR